MVQFDIFNKYICLKIFNKFWRILIFFINIIFYVVLIKIL